MNNQETNTELLHNQYAPQIEASGNQPYPPQQYPAQPYPPQQYPAQPYPPQPYPAQPYQQQPHLVVQTFDTNNKAGYSTNLPEKVLVMSCPYCKREGVTKLSYRYHGCCIFLLILSLFNALMFLVNPYPIVYIGSMELTSNAAFFGILLPDVLLWALCFYLSRAYVHKCGGCERDLGRGKPSIGCCTATID